MSVPRAVRDRGSPTLIENCVQTGKVFCESRLIASLGAESERGRIAMIAACLPGKFFQLGQLLYPSSVAYEFTGDDATIARAIEAAFPS